MDEPPSEILTVDGLTYAYPAKAGVRMIRDSDGRVLSGYLATSAKINSLDLQCEISFWSPGKVRLGYLCKPARINRMSFEGYIYFFDNGRIGFGRLTSDTKVEGLVLKGSTYAEFHESGGLASGCLAEDYSKRGHNLPAGAYVKIDKTGRVERVDLTHLNRTWVSDKGGVRYECSLAAMRFSCGASGNCEGSRFAEWGTSVPLREFLLGHLQDFPVEHQPEHLFEISKTCVIWEIDLDENHRGPFDPYQYGIDGLREERPGYIEYPVQKRQTLIDFLARGGPGKGGDAVLLRKSVLDILA